MSALLTGRRARWQLVALLALLLGGGAALAWSARRNPAGARAAEPELAPPLPEVLTALEAELAHLPARAERIVLVAAGTALGADDAPRYALARSGRPFTRRPGSMPTGPIASAPARITIEVPDTSLAAATPEVRAALLVMLAHFGLRGPRAAAAIELRGLTDDPEDLVRLLRWMP